MVKKKQDEPNPAVELGKRGGKAFREKVQRMTASERKKFSSEMKKRGKSGAAKRWGKKGGK